MKYLNLIKKALIIEGILIVFAGTVIFHQTENTGKEVIAIGNSEKAEVIKWAEFHPTAELMKQAAKLDIETKEDKIHLNWIDLLALLAAKHGGEFPKGAGRELNELAEKVKTGTETVESMSKNLKLYAYFQQVYHAVLDGFIGEYEIQVPDMDREGMIWETRYGLKSFSPIAKDFYYQDYDDFGASRSFGYKRRHLGHDMMGQIGTPIICIESGYVEVLGWNQYGGWRIGIRSFDRKRYYYYAHLRQNFPYCKSLQQGSIVTAGDVIGYMGHTGYSSRENVNNIKTTHLHWGMQLIFDESQKESQNEIWIDCYELSRFLYQNRCETKKCEATGEWRRVYEMKDIEAEEYRKRKAVPDFLQNMKSYEGRQ